MQKIQARKTPKPTIGAWQWSYRTPSGTIPEDHMPESVARVVAADRGMTLIRRPVDELGTGEWEEVENATPETEIACPIFDQLVREMYGDHPQENPEEPVETEPEQADTDEETETPEPEENTEDDAA